MPQQRPWLATYKTLEKCWEAVPAVPEKNLSDYIREHAHGFSDRVALVYGDQEITYRELNHQADLLARAIKKQQVKAGDVIALQMPNVPQYVVALVAAARLGVVVTSVSPLLTVKEASTQCNDAKVKLLITVPGLFQAMGNALVANVSSLNAVFLAAPVSENSDLPRNVSVLDWPGIMSQPAEPLSFPAISMDDVLYLQYTGGTTGKAKAAQLTSRHILTNNIQANLFYGLRLGMETVASAFPFFHIGGIAVLMNALRTAATFLVVPDPRNLDDYCSLMERFPPTVLANVPTLFQMLMGSERFCALDFSVLKIAISGAAPFPEEEIKKLEHIIGKDKYCEVYGMTETSPVQTLNPAERFKPGFVGVPLPGTDLKIMDVIDGDKEMPLGEPGEVVVAGPQVMLGYRQAEQANAKALREIDGKTWMYTGDIGFLDDEGYLKICDRSKDMLIVGGYKVFSVELENKLQELPFIAMSAVVGVPDEARPGNDIVQLYIQPVPEAALTEQEMEEQVVSFCKQNFAPYKVPKGIHFVDALPLTSVGKLDKKALRDTQKELESA